ncbi:YciI family protein [Telmatospirillum siberiense]|uniref:GTP cyclohydrolase n=1 Tax=Telmatospirillum siberiense TaxID=382514 RepID=A0A2N3PM71_9PROT|nr:YciI family protein [Telmatospirillum siberiense]PKU21501.1 GTP cyclohydrolase [Telmatospirillum siberiense]
MFIVILRYTAPLADLDKVVDAHREWVGKGFSDGVFLLSGPQNPRTGGAILAHGLSRGELDARLAQDPFNKGRLADYEVIELAPRAADPRLDFLLAD